VKFASKKELVDSIEDEHRTFVELAGSIPRKRWREAGVWGDDWNIRDLFAHLTAWEQMFLRWHREGCDGETPEIPAPGYKCNQTPALNRAIRAAHARKSVQRVRAEFDASYDEILAVVRALSEPELLTPGHFAWTRKYPLTTYLAPNTCSHYRTATKFLKRWLRSQR